MLVPNFYARKSGIEPTTCGNAEVKRKNTSNDGELETTTTAESEQTSETKVTRKHQPTIYT